MTGARLIFGFLLMVFLAPFAAAQDAPLERLDTWGRNRGWEGVGILRIGDFSTCTGSMISSDLVLTAAHCMFDSSGNLMPPRKIEFRAGWRNGKSVAQRFGKAAIVHPGYSPGDGLTNTQIRNDLALLQLQDPIQSTHADPFTADRGVKSGADVSVVSYGKGRNDAPSRQRVCEVLEAQEGLVMMTCDVVPGSSGAPVFRMDSGQPRIVSVVSALGASEGRRVSFGMDIEAPLAKLMKDFRNGEGVYPAVTQSARRLTVGSGRKSIGAKFARP